ncbi:MAG: DNA translocase FtsK 4TM domain-containing protein [Desulfamplus sp.]|nr:DNA translocase FtsK 4TM domain-containing protein [Desulfamplus sp.]
MRKELLTILLLFFVVFTSVSLVSHSPHDPSVNHQAFSSDHIQNLFGLAGAHLSGLLVGLFGLASLWIPLFIFLCTLWHLTRKSTRQIVMTITGGTVLLFSTAGILPIIREHVIVRGGQISSGGLTGSAISAFLVKYTSTPGSVVILLFFIFSGVVITTGIPASQCLSVIRDFTFIFLRFVGLKAVEANNAVMTVAGRIKDKGCGTGSDQNVSSWQSLGRLPDFRMDFKLISWKKEAKQKDAGQKEPEQSGSDLPVEQSSSGLPVEQGGSGLPVQDAEGSVSVDTSGTVSQDVDFSPLGALTRRIKSFSSKKQEEDSSKNRIQASENRTEPSENRTDPSNYRIQPPEKGLFTLPPLSLLNDKQKSNDGPDMEALKQKGEILDNKLRDFGVKGEIVDILPGPVITTFEYRPAPVIKISKIVNLTDDLALALSALSIRIVAPIPGKDVVGIEIPNDRREIVLLKELLASSDFMESSSRLTLGLGKDILGNPVSAPMDSMPHLLIAGATGTGKSVGLNAMIISLLYKARPDEVKFIMVDPKRIELSVYDGIPHLISPVVTDMKKATNALFWAVREMERRYELLAQNGVRNLLQYNTLVDRKLEIKRLNSNHDNSDLIAPAMNCVDEGNQVTAGEESSACQESAPNTENENSDMNENPDMDESVLERLPYIVVIVDEFADLMMVASRDVESALIRLAQMARAAGIHIILATQRPSVDVLTGIIKANFPTRISFQVSSRIDSRTILDTNGSERLLGNGDMLFLPPGTGRLQRIQGAYISEEEIARVTSFLKEQQQPDYVEDITEKAEDSTGGDDEEPYDEKYDEAVALVARTRQASISSVQRHLRIGYNRAARIIETMEREGLVGPQDGSKPREVLVKSYDE